MTQFINLYKKNCKKENKNLNIEIKKLNLKNLKIHVHKRDKIYIKYISKGI